MDQPVKRPKLSDVLYADLLEQIRSKRIAADGRLPSEHQLAERFRVSRPIVRTALRRLRDEGVLVSRKGSGSFVNGTSGVPGAQPTIGEAPPLMQSIADVHRFYAFRIILEGEIAHEAALCADDAALAEIDTALRNTEAALKAGNNAVYQDFEFHLAIAKATRNQFFVAAHQSTHPFLRYVIDLALSFTGRSRLQHDSLVLRDHRLIVEAIRRRDGPAARQAMRQHIERARDRVFLGIETLPQ